MTTTFLQGICGSLKSIETADDNKIVRLCEQAAQGKQQSLSQPAHFGNGIRVLLPALGRSLSFQQHKGGRVSMKSTLSTVSST